MQSKIKIGCSGFPVAQKRYQEKFPLVELNQLFKKTPLDRTVEKWRRTASKGFEFIVCASETITHHASSASLLSTKSMTHHHHSGHFQDNAHVRQAFQKTIHMAETLASKVVIFKLPSNLTAHADNVGRLHQFFKAHPRHDKLFVWEPPHSWPHSLVEQLTTKLNLTPATNPLNARIKLNGPFRYFRLGNATQTKGIHQFTNWELDSIKKACDKPLCYVIFNNGPTAYEDALRFSKMTGTNTLTP